jgi:hypothetical protein
MHRRYLARIWVVGCFAVGCSIIGNNEMTSTPTNAQVHQCRMAMYINPSVKITPLGFRRDGSGSDSAMWFKFATTHVELADIFDSDVVDTSDFTFDNEYILLHHMNDTVWWDVKNKQLLGGQVLLPNSCVMNIGIDSDTAGYTVYIMWHET